MDKILTKEELEEEKRQCVQWMNLYWETSERKKQLGYIDTALALYQRLEEAENRRKALVEKWTAETIDTEEAIVYNEKHNHASHNEFLNGKTRDLRLFLQDLKGLGEGK